ncbi:hypothetical protein MCUN1_002181 [Malassezia cuniculi]|uniref:Uncharacterized protein n=1 Tax=Malassezia cuniculi TaxID=948313 RepID=A0AAF0EUK5_9BASI|nr:hypothetical protein MCUN1_002181 [Malassezia cuniculi]
MVGGAGNATPQQDVAPEQEEQNGGQRDKGASLLKWVASTSRHPFGRSPHSGADEASSTSGPVPQYGSDEVDPTQGPPPSSSASQTQELRTQSSIESFTSVDTSSGNATEDEAPDSAARPAPPFLYPLSTTEAEHLSVPVSPATAFNSGAATPIHEARSGATTPHVSRGYPWMTHMGRSSISMTPRVNPLPISDGQPSYFALNMQQMPSPVSASSNTGFPGGPNVPPSPSAISMSRRASMVGQPMAWVSTPRGSTSGSNTPAQRSASIFYSPWTPRASVTPMPQSPGIPTSASPRMQSGVSRPEPGSSAPLGQADDFPSTSAENEPLWHRRLCHRLENMPSVSTEYVDEKDAEFFAQVEGADARQNAERNALLQKISESLLNLGGGGGPSLPITPPFVSKTDLDIDFDFPECGLTDTPYESDGKESLPQYTCSVHLEGFLPRKMEYDAPGEPSHNRTWHSCYFVLHGTLLHVYSVDLARFYTKEHPLSNEWCLTEAAQVHTSPYSLAETEPASDEESHEKNSLANRLGHGILHMVHLDHDPTSLADALKRSHMRTYSLANAECGFASDYTKRPYVVRFRIQGEQFIVQTRDNYHVVDLIEAFQASVNICADLDTRTLPKFLTLPRRRRRRRGAETVTLRTSPQAPRTVTT